ncbi:MAG: DUF4294 domain-containing protein [Bacteroidia bacterium]|nr:DUF4294 domain-containing protein [Bacteroidia bacterium]
MNFKKTHLVNITILIAYLSIYNIVNAQDTTKRHTRLVRYEVVDGDTFPVYSFDEFILRDLNDPDARKKYERLVRNIKKTLPYAKLTAFKLQMIEDNLSQIKSKRKREKYLKQHEKALKKDFEEQLKNLSVTQGLLLMKLIHRETGITTYELLKKYKGSMNAFMWQSFARFYGSDTKQTYDPVEDYQIEHIIRSLEIEDK